MVEEETRRYRPTKNYLENVLPATTLMTAFETPLMKAEFDRVASRSPMDTLSMKRYELPTPPAAKLSDVAAWNECVDNSMAQLEHQRTRITNLELMSEFGTEAWKIYNKVLERMAKEADVSFLCAHTILSFRLLKVHLYSDFLTLTNAK